MADYTPFLRALPKCEHHIHLEGALTPTLLFALAAQNNISLPSPSSDPSFSTPETLLARYARFTSLDDFLAYYYIGMSVLITASDFEALGYAYFAQAARDGVAHVEAFFDPQAHLSRGVAYGTVLEGLTRAQRRAEDEFGISTMLTSCFLRHLPARECVDVFRSEEVQRSYRDGVVGAIGLDSSEVAFPPEWFEELFQGAKGVGLRRTAHAGEEGPAGYIRNALDVLGVERIDHGIRLVEDEALMKRVAEEGVLLTVCPMSNVVLRCVDKIEDVPIRKLLDAGVKFSINSDDPAYFGGYCLDNYVKVHEVFQLSVKEWEGIVRAGIEGSWCGDERKGQLLEKLKEVVNEWEGKLA